MIQREVDVRAHIEGFFDSVLFDRGEMATTKMVSVRAFGGKVATAGGAAVVHVSLTITAVAALLIRETVFAIGHVQVLVICFPSYGEIQWSSWHGRFDWIEVFQ